MSRLERQFASALAEGLKPVTPDEVVCPTRVTWRAPNGMTRTQVFPTFDRAFDFALEKPGSEVSSVKEPVSRQPDWVYKNRYALHVKSTERLSRAKSRQPAGP